ncbi:MAG: YafY family transcriptional regulator [Defluviitaleaceae bacterium]|nr:YafY family transcriptional regulator [Defluviitaleaceae bacterium]
MQTTRQFEIVYILLNKGKVSANDLALRFGVSTRTIYRDVDALSLAGIPIYTEQGKGGGISLLPDFVLDKSILNEDEQSEILMALRGLSIIKPDESRDVLHRLSAIFNKTADDWIKVDFSDWSYDDGYFNELKMAILQRRVVEFDYYNSYSQKSFRRIEPIQLWFKAHSWYIKGFCLQKQGFRLYKLSRVKNLAVADESFDMREFLNIEKAEDDENTSNYITVKLRIAKEMAYRAFDNFDESRIERQDDGSFIVTAQWEIDNWVYGYILSFGEYIKIIEPESLKNAIVEKIIKMSKIYL